VIKLLKVGAEKRRHGAKGVEEPAELFHIESKDKKAAIKFDALNDDSEYEPVLIDISHRGGYH
jgi:hypothetical protein